MNYTIQNNETYFWTGKNKENEQLIMGLLAPHLLIYHFDQEGNYLKQELLPLTSPPSRDSESGIYLLNSQFMAGFSTDLKEVKIRIGFQPGSVSTKEFFDPNHYVGISSYPSDYQEFLDFPDRFADEDKQAYESHIKRWSEDGNFVFCWGEEYWMSREGEIESS